MKNDNTELGKLKNLLHGLYEYNFDYRVDYITVGETEYIYLFQDNKLSFIVKIHFSDRVLRKKDVVDELNRFRRIGKEERCFNFRLIAPGGYAKSAYELEQYNLILSDQSYIDDLRLATIPFELYPHNFITYSKILRMFKGSNRVGVVQATGTGKSVLIARFLFDNQDNNTVVVSPNKFVFGQLKKFIKHRDNISYITYAKSRLLTKKELKELKADIIVLDEYHRAGAEEWSNGVDALLDAYPNAEILGTTATPERSDERNMADELFDGRLAVNITLNRAIQEYIVPAPYYVSALYTLDQEAEDLKQRILNSNSDQKDHLVEKLLVAKNKWRKSKGVPVILEKHIPKEARKLIVFCKDIEHLQEMEPVVVKWFKEAGFLDIKTYSVHSNAERIGSIFDSFENDTSDRLNLLFSVNMLNEGVHVHNIDGAIFLRKTESNIVYFQQLGRGITVDFAKQPLVIDLVNNFKNVRWSYHGDEQVDRQRSIDGLDSFDVGLTVFDEVKEINELFESFSNQVESWSVFFKKLEEFKGTYNHCLVPMNYKDRWLANRTINARVQIKRRGSLNKHVINSLDKLGFVWDVPTYKWNLFLNDLIKFKIEFGHYNVTSSYKGVNFMMKVFEVGRKFNNGSLNQFKAESLLSIGFNYEKKHKYTFNLFIEDLQRFHSKHGHFKVPSDYENKLLSKAVKSYGSLLNKGEMSSEKTDIFKQIGFEYDLKSIYSWNEFIDDVEVFFKTNKHFIATKSDGRLYSKMEAVRGLKKSDQLPYKVIKELDRLSFVWDVDEYKREVLFNDISEFIKEFGHCFVVQGEHKSLYRKCYNLRKNYVKGNLSNDYIKRLNALGFVWDVEEHKWNIFIKKLIKHKNKFGNFNVASNYSDNEFKLHVIRIGKKFIANSLSSGHVADLKKIGFSWTVTKSYNWSKFVEDMKLFHKSYGHCVVPHDYSDQRLYNKMRSARGRRGQGTLDKLYIDQLNDIGFIWNSLNENWNVFYNELCDFNKKHGHCDLSAKDIGYEHLHKKVRAYRAKFRLGRMPDMEIVMLENIGFIWNTLDHGWDIFLSKLTEFKNTHGHLKIPYKYKDKSLYNRMQATRYKYGRNKLSNNKIDQLLNIGFVFNPRG